VDELRSFLGRLELVNGFANRFLLVCTRRSKSLPEGGGLTEDEINHLAARLRTTLDAARKIGRVERDPEARELWAKMYVEMSADQPALFGAATSRAAAQVLRLSLIYALLDGSEIVRPQHLRAAREVWRYCENSARFVLGEGLDPMADRLLVALRNADEDGLTGTEIRDLFGRHASIEDIKRPLAQLNAAGLVARVREKTAGRPVTRWIAT
jgi:DNA replicative helicase MCM subunit Mcm2 (Cdc46/Mcm family)